MEGTGEGVQGERRGEGNQLAKPTCVWIQGCGSFYYIHRIRRSSHQYKVHVDGPIPSSRRIDNRRPCPRREPRAVPRPHSSVYLGLLRLSAYTVVRVATSARSAELLIRADHAPSGARAEAAGGAGVAVPKMLPGCRLATWSREARARPAGKGAGLAYGDNIYDRVKTHLPRGGRSLPFCRGLPCTARAASPWHRPSGRSGATSTSTLHYYVNYEVQFDGFAIRARVIRGPTLRGL